MNGDRWRQRVYTHVLRKPFPRPTPTIRSPIEPVAPAPLDLVQKAAQGVRVFGDPVIPVVAPQLLRKLPVLFDTIPRGQDRSVALREAARVLKPAARLVLTTWERDKPSRVVQPSREAVADYRPLIEHAGLEIEVYEESRDWKDRNRAFHEHIIAARSELRIELGDGSADTMMHIARQSLAEIDERRRVFAVARRVVSSTRLLGCL